MRFKASENKSTRLLIVLLILFFLAGCAFKVKLVGQYDDIVDKSVHQLESKTTAHTKKIIDSRGTADGSFDQNKQFYSDTKGEVQALIVRAEALEKGLERTPLTDNFKKLLEQYNDLETLHQTPFNEDVISMAQEALDMSFRAIVKHLIYMKWNQEIPKDN
jgi:PBP1b-binding outer membrane lipoprotein LpoB